MSVTDNRITETQLNDLRCLAGQMQQKAEAVDDRDTAVMAYAVQTVCTELSELRIEHAAAMNTIASIIDILGTSEEFSISVQVSALVAQRDALAAENTGLMNVDSWMSRDDVGYAAQAIAEGNGAGADESLRAGMRAIIDDIPTPATDAFRAEVRAQGVEMLADHLSGMSINVSETSIREFAAQLRQGESK